MGRSHFDTHEIVFSIGSIVLKIHFRSNSWMHSCKTPLDFVFLYGLMDADLWVQHHVLVASVSNYSTESLFLNCVQYWRTHELSHRMFHWQLTSVPSTVSTRSKGVFLAQYLLGPSLVFSHKMRCGECLKSGILSFCCWWLDSWFRINHLARLRAPRLLLVPQSLGIKRTAKRAMYISIHINNRLFAHSICFGQSPPHVDASGIKLESGCTLQKAEGTNVVLWMVLFNGAST